jgi:cobalamin biosynthesis protein CobD/CbiB
MKIYQHIPHPRITSRRMRTQTAQPLNSHPVARFNALLGERITRGVGTMWCAYAFALLALISLPNAIQAGTSSLITWIAQTFLQLVLLSIIMVGQKVEGAAADDRAAETYKDAEAILHEALEIQKHLEAQDELLQRVIGP